MTNRIGSLVGLALLLTAVSASAQTSQTIQVKVPFTFVVAGKTLPAATYRVQIARSSGSELVSLLTSAGVTLTTQQASNDYRPGDADKTYLQFQRFGESWVLQEVTVNGHAQLLTVGKSERELAKLNPPAQQTLIASSVGAQ